MHPGEKPISRCSVHGGRPADRENVRALCLAAMHALGYSEYLRVEIREDPKAPPNVTASASADGIRIAPRLACDPARLLWQIYEEVAHVYLERTQGVPHGGTFAEVLLQEMFATWFQLRVFVLGGVMSWSEVSATPIPPGGETPKVGYYVGKHIAATALGGTASEPLLTEWLGDERVPQNLRDAASALVEVMPFKGSPSELAAAIGAFYSGAKGSS